MITSGMLALIGLRLNGYYAVGLQCYHGQERRQKDYNNLPAGPLHKYKIQAIDATNSCIMCIGCDYMEGPEHVEKIILCKCHYIEDDCLQRLSQLEKLQKAYWKWK